MCNKFGEALASFGKKVYQIVKDNVKVGVDVNVKTPVTNDLNYHITSDQVADKIEQKMNKKEVINPVYFMSDARSEEMQKEYQKQLRG